MAGHVESETDCMIGTESNASIISQDDYPYVSVLDVSAYEVYPTAWLPYSTTGY